jgi:dTDP-4-amino-4,6-dideoxygalactose transaminase
MARIFLSPPETGTAERDLIMEALDSNWVAPLGPHVDAFEREMAAYAGVRSGAALTSGTAALHLALRLVGVGPSDTVIVPSLTFIASAAPVCYLGASPVFIDSRPDTWVIDADMLDDFLGAEARRGARKPAAVVSVDLYGQCADYDSLDTVTSRYEIPLIEDAAEALGSTYRSRPAGAFGRAAVFSFNGNKIITSSGGGMLVSNDEDMISKARWLASQARDPAPHYEHSELGYNYRMSNLLAALGRAQLRDLGRRVQRRREINSLYQASLAHLRGVSFMPAAGYGEPNRWLTVLTVDPSLTDVTPENIRLALENVEIEARPVWKPLHMQPVFGGMRAIHGEVAEELFGRGLCLPSGSSLKDGDVERVVRTVGGVFDRVRV